MRISKVPHCGSEYCKSWRGKGGGCHCACPFCKPGKGKTKAAPLEEAQKRALAAKLPRVCDGCKKMSETAPLVCPVCIAKNTKEIVKNELERVTAHVLEEAADHAKEGRSDLAFAMREVVRRLRVALTHDRWEPNGTCVAESVHWRGQRSLFGEELAEVEAWKRKANNA